MSFLQQLASFFSQIEWHSAPAEHHDTQINPASGLPMIHGIGSVDVQGNPYGLDAHRWHDDHVAQAISDPFRDQWLCSSAGYDPARGW